MSVINVPNIALSLGLLVTMLSINDDLSLQNLVLTYTVITLVVNILKTLGNILETLRKYLLIH